MTTNVSIADQPQGNWCPVCMDSWLPDTVPVKVKMRWSYETICGRCAREIGVTARKEQRRRKLESEAVRGKKEQGQ